MTKDTTNDQNNPAPAKPANPTGAPTEGVYKSRSDRPNRGPHKQVFVCGVTKRSGPVRQDQPAYNPPTQPAKKPSTQPFDDRRMEIIIGRLLQTGVLLASTTVLIGGALFLIEHHSQPANYRIFSSQSANFLHPSHLLPLLARGDAAAIIQIGILLLIATPVARVAFAVIGFAIERDRLYTLVSLAILAILLLSLFH